MNRDDIIRMGYAVAGPNKWWQDDSDLEEFAALVAATEREACARLCDEIQETCWESWDTQADPLDQGSAICAGHCAAAIRARGEA